MKKFAILLLTVVTLSICQNSYAQHPDEVDFTILTDESMEDKFYPSLAIWNASLEDPSDLFYSFYLVAPEEGSVVRITVEETPLNEETIIQETATEAGEMIIDPIIKWDYEKLATLSQGGTVTMTCILEIDGKEIDRINNIVKYRPINECVYGFVSGDEWIDCRWLFAMYVNEDYPAIDKILQEILAVDRSRTFVDYQGSAQDFLNQVVWVWEYFSLQGTRYSNVVNTSNVSETVGSQYVRFIDQVLGNTQANCVDGSALLASIYRKIGLETYLVLVPGHCMLAIGYPGDINMGEFGATGEDGGVLLLETTLMGSNTDPITSFDSAVSVYSYADFFATAEENEYLVVSIEDARADGIMPISRN